jgi:hypothetical protein
MKTMPQTMIPITASKMVKAFFGDSLIFMAATAHSAFGE